MKSAAWRALNVITLICWIAMVVVTIVLGGCDTQLELASGATVPMKCHWTFVAIQYIATLGIVCSLCSLAANACSARRLVSIIELATLAVIGCITSPLGIGICAKAEMGCHVSAYITWGICVVVAILVIVKIVKANPEDASRPKMQI